MRVYSTNDKKKKIMIDFLLQYYIFQMLIVTIAPLIYLTSLPT